MSTYLIPIQTAILTFPILAAFITIPYIIIQYRRYGSIHPLRVAIVYSFIFYLLCAYFLVIMPLPPIDEVAKYTTPIMQLIPFEGYKEFSLSTSLVLNDPSTYWAALNEPSLFLIVFNILLTVPFGVYLRYYFQCSWKKTLLYSFFLTSSFECMQLSALFGIYPRPYRLFDVDDLINNTLGGMIGYAITPLLVHFLPSRSHLDESSLHKGKMVSPLRRMTAFFIDVTIISLCCIFVVIALTLSDIVSLRDLTLVTLYVYYIAIILIIFIISLFTKGKTLGKALVNIRLVNKENNPLRWYQQLLHYGIIYLFLLPCPYMIFLLLTNYFNVTTSNISYELFLAVVLFIAYVICIIQCIPTIFQKDRYTWYDRFVGVHNVSTITIEQNPIEPQQMDPSVCEDTIDDEPM